jgi:hypothetical protein
MKISNKYGNLRDDHALVIVTGKQDAVLYLMKAGHMEKLDAFKIPKPRFSDNEGHAQMRGRGEMIASGWTRELRDEDIISEFVGELKKRLKSINSDFDKVYLFVPSQNKNAIKKALPKPIADKIEAEVSGNYYYRSPQYLLDKLISQK